MHVITPAAITVLWRARVKARSAAAMEMNGSVNREPRPGDACLGLSIFQPKGLSGVICLALKLAIVPPSIIG